MPDKKTLDKKALDLNNIFTADGYSDPSFTLQYSLTLGSSPIMRAFLQRIAAIILPHQCVICRQFADSTGLCTGCWSALSPITTPFCQKCGLPLAETLTSSEPDLTSGLAIDSICASCWVKPPPLAAIRAGLKYDDMSRALILKLKHGDGLQLVPLLGRMLASRFVEFSPAKNPETSPETSPETNIGGNITKFDTANREDPLIISIPLHRWRYLQRRFNQSAELARFLCTHTGKGQYAPEILMRRRRTQTQGQLSRHARQTNMIGAFDVHPNAREMLVGRRVLLVDDVMTTGATIFAASRALKAAGAGDISALVMARVI